MINTYFLGKNSGSKFEAWCKEKYGQNESDPLTFTSIQDGSTLSFSWKTGENVEYKLNSNDWTQYLIGTSLTLNNNDIIAFRGSNVTTDISGGFQITGKVLASGSVTSLIDRCGVDQSVQLVESQFISMFMFCSGLLSVPKLISTKLNDNCYQYMFAGCSGISSVVNLDLPAQQMASSCYYSMFAMCDNLEVGPTIHATSFAEMCFMNMFGSNSKFKSFTFLGPNLGLAQSATEQWLYQVSNSGTFNCTSECKRYIDTMPYPRSHSTIPSSWTIQII